MYLQKSKKYQKMENQNLKKIHNPTYCIIKKIINMWLLAEQEKQIKESNQNDFVFKKIIEEKDSLHSQ